MARCWAYVRSRVTRFFGSVRSAVFDLGSGAPRSRVVILELLYGSLELGDTPRLGREIVES